VSPSNPNEAGCQIITAHFGKAQLSASNGGIPDGVNGRTHRVAVAEAQTLLEGFLVVLQQVGHQEGACLLSLSSPPRAIGTTWSMVGNSSQNAGCVSVIFQLVWKGTTSGTTLARSLRTPGKKAISGIAIDESIPDENLGEFRKRIVATGIAKVGGWVVLLDRVYNREYYLVGSLISNNAESPI